MSNWPLLNAKRITTGMFASRDSDGFNGMFEFWIGANRVKCVASDELGWQHVSVSLTDHPNVAPRWEVMCNVKDLFGEDEDCVIQLHPQKSRYISNHHGCLHLWRCTDGREQPQPPDEMVGVKKWDSANVPAIEKLRHYLKVNAKP